MKTEKKTIIFFGASMLLAVILVGLYAFVFSAMKNTSEETLPVVDRIDQLSSREARVAASLKTLEKEKENIEKITGYYFKADEIVLFTRKIEDLGPRSNTALTIESLEQGVAEKSTPYLTFSIRATGKFPDIQRLFLLIENFPGKLEWKTVNLTRSSDSSSDWRVDIRLIARNFIN